MAQQVLDHLGVIPVDPDDGSAHLRGVVGAVAGGATPRTRRRETHLFSKNMTCSRCNAWSCSDSINISFVIKTPKVNIMHAGRFSLRKSLRFTCPSAARPELFPLCTLRRLFLYLIVDDEV